MRPTYTSAGTLPGQHGAAMSVKGPMPRHRLHNADARELRRLVPQGSVDLVLTSPPYAGLKNYGYEGQIGFGQSLEAYLQDMRSVLEACFNVAKPTATLWLVSDVFKTNGAMVDLPGELARSASDAGWKLQDIVIWHKTKTLPWSPRGRLRKIFEYIHVFAKSKAYKYYPERIRETEGLQEWWVKYPERYNPLGKTPHNIWHFPIPTQGSWGNSVVRHFNPFPPALVERIVELTTDPGDVVLDPFAGTGTVLAQAECMGRHATGVELNPDFTDQLFPKVRAEIEEAWSRQSHLREERHRRAERFDSLILRMRKVKLGKQVVKMLTGQKPAIRAGFVLEREDVPDDDLAPHKIGLAHLVLVADTLAEAETIAGWAQALCGQPPLSKYGIQVEVQGCAVSQLTEGPVARRLSTLGPLFVYPAGIYHVHDGVVQLDQLLSFCVDGGEHRWVRGDLPPVFSDIAVAPEEIQRFRGLPS